MILLWMPCEVSIVMSTNRCCSTRNNAAGVDTEKVLSLLPILPK